MRNFTIADVTPIGLKWDGKQSGIYCIRNRVNGKFYIGSSVNCYKRIKTHHYGRLRNGVHTNPHLQSAWNLYGENAFEAFIVELCDPDDLFQVEQEYIDGTGCLKGEIGYNCNQFADRVVLTDEQKAKISAAKMGKPRDLITKARMKQALLDWQKDNPIAYQEMLKKRAIKTSRVCIERNTRGIRKQ